MERRGVEPPTSALRTQPLVVLTENLPEVMSTEITACTNACTSEPENRRKLGSDTVSVDAPITTPEPGSQDFAAALGMIASLPVSDAEKAEAVRRLLGGK